MARVKAAESRVTDADSFEVQAKEYAFVKKQLDHWDKQQKALKEKLFTHIEELGEVDDKGNVIIEFPEEIEGFVSVMKQRRVSRKIDEQRAEEIIAEKGLEELLYKTIRVIDEDALMAALYSDELTEEEVDEMYPQNVVWALVMNKR